MEYAKLGNTDIEVSKLCVGCMSFGKAGTMHKWTLDEEQSGEVIRHSLNTQAMFRKDLKLQCGTVSIKNIQAKKLISCLIAMSLAMINNLTYHNNETNTFNSILQST